MSIMAPLNLLGEGVGDFELFNLKDMWGKIKDDPWRIFVGGATPVGTELWNTILDRDDEPIVNMLGGPMGSGFAGLGSGGVYDRAQEAGIDTKRANQLHDIAEVAALTFGTAGAAGAFGGGGAGAGAGGGGATTYALPETGALSGGEFINAAGEPIAGGSGGMFSGFGDMNWMDMAQMMPQGGMGQQEPQPRPMPQMPYALPGYVDPMMADPTGTPVSPRTIPLGLLSDEDEQMITAMMGGLL